MTTRKTIWLILTLAALTFLIVGVVDILIVGGITLRNTVQFGTRFLGFSDTIGLTIPKELPPSDSYESLKADSSLAANTINYKRLHIDVDATRVAVSYDVYIRKDHPLFQLVERQTGEDLAEKLTNKLLGAVSVSDQLLKFERIETTISDTDDNAHIFVIAAPYPLVSNTFRVRVHAKQFSSPLSFASKEVLVHTQGVNVRAGWPFLPVSKTQDDTRYVLPPDADEIDFYIDVLNPVTKPDPPSGDTLAAMLQKQPHIPGLNHFIYGLLEAIPFVLFIFWCRRYQSDVPNADLKQQVITTYLILHFSYFFFYSLNYLIEEWRNPFMSALGYFERRFLPVFAAASYKNSTYILLPMAAMFLYVWPTLARTDADAAQLRTSRWRGLLTRILAIILFVGLLALAGWALGRKFQTIRAQPENLTVADFYLLFFAVMVFTLYVLVLFLGRVLSGPKGPGVTLSLFSLVMLLVAADLFYGIADGSRNKYLQTANGIASLIIFSTAAFAITWTFAALCYRAITSRSVHADWKIWTAKKRVLVIVILLAVALSTRYGSWSWPMKYWPLWWLVWELKDLFFLILVWFLASFLRQASANHDWLKLPESVRDAGILLALCLFYSATTYWKFIPVTFIVGLFLLKFWLLPRIHFDRDVISDIKSGLTRYIERTIAFNDALRALTALKKELLTKLGKGELEPKAYYDKLNAQVEAVATCRQDLMVQNQFAKDYVLALGPGDSAWRNGLRVALYSILFSIPWCLLYLRDLVRAQVTSESYLLLDLFNAIVYFLLAWLSYGFIFGYFYPYIRGKNGMRKGAVMFLTIVLPDLVWTALVRTTDGPNWISFGFWTLQIFIQMMLLGLIAGDYSILRSNGFMWGHLMDFYRLRFLSAWASSVVLAIAAAASTLITSGATEILTSALKYVGVMPENVQLPIK